MLARAAVEMIERKDELARALTLEEGKTLGESLGEVQKAINNLEFQSGEGRRLNGETVPSELPSTFCWTQREPLGVVALVTPWNFPVAIPVWKLGAGAGLRQHGGAQAGVDHAVDGQDHRRDLRRRGAAQGRAQRRLRARLDGGADAGRASRRQGDLVHRLERGRHQAVRRRARRA